MNQTDYLLRQRIAEIRQFKSFIEQIERLERGRAREIFHHASDHNRNRRILYSQFVLMHYSLVEGIMTQGVTEWINNALNSKPRIADISDQFLQYIVRCKIKGLREQDFSKWPPAIAMLLSACADEIILSIDEKEARSLWPGNLDARKIRVEILDRFGIAFTDKASRSGSDIVNIKDHRNDLTHGIKSWEDVGQEYSWPDLKKISNRVILYLIRVLREMRKQSSLGFWKKTNQTAGVG